MPLKVIGAGLGRTGTLSLKAALEDLGFFRCYHMVEVLAHPEHVRVWDAAARGEPVDWEALLRGYQATVDWPACNFYAEFARLYPDAKVILTVRDPERWYDSALHTIYAVGRALPRWAMPFNPRFRLILGMADRLIWSGMFQGRFEDRAFALDVFRRHTEEVRRTVPPDRLLVYEVKEGWSPLCAFLDVPVPENKPFPHLNDAEDFRARLRRANRIVKGSALVMVALAAILLAWLVRLLVT